MAQQHNSELRDHLSPRLRHMQNESDKMMLDALEFGGTVTTEPAAPTTNNAVQEDDQQRSTDNIPRIIAMGIIDPNEV